MSMENLGPYTNFHELNQDWFLQEFNKLIDQWKAMRKNFDNVQDAFNDLKNYVQDYFKNLNVQEEINNKMDEIVNSGRLDILMQNYVPYVTPQMFGAKGDNITDDTVAFQKCFDSNKKIIVPNGEYLVGKCEVTNNCDIELFSKAYITIKDEYFIHKTKPLTIKGGRFYGEIKAPESRYYEKKAITGDISNINITDTQFYQCIALYKTDGDYSGFINCINMWVYDSQFIISDKSVNYVSCLNCVLQNASNMIEATNYENFLFNSCSIENVTYLFSPTYTNAPYNGLILSGCYIEYSSLFNNGNCKTITVENSWIYTDKTLIELSYGPGTCMLRQNTINIIKDVVLTNVKNCSLIIEFGVGSIKKQNTIINRSNINTICTENCIAKIYNQDEYYINPFCDNITFSGKESNIPHSLYVDESNNKLYYKTGVSNLKANTFVGIIISLGKSDLLTITPPIHTLAIEQSSHILYMFDGTHWRKTSDGSILS